MKRGWLFDLFAAVAVGFAQALSPIQKYQPTPPDNAFMLPPNLNQAEPDELVDLLGVSPELARRIADTRPHLGWENLRAKLAEVPEEVWERLEGRVRF